MRLLAAAAPLIGGHRTIVGGRWGTNHMSCSPACLLACLPALHCSGQLRGSLRQRHMHHHYADGCTGFGISSSLFDVIFGTQQHQGQRPQQKQQKQKQQDRQQQWQEQRQQQQRQRAQSADPKLL